MSPLLTTLQSARNHIAQHGHCKYAYTSAPIEFVEELREPICATAPLCLAGAFIRYTDSDEEYMLVLNWLLTNGKANWIAWNDLPTTTQQDVLDLLDSCIEKASR